jgi:hypothetical protein
VSLDQHPGLGKWQAVDETIAVDLVNRASMITGRSTPCGRAKRYSCRRTSASPSPASTGWAAPRASDRAVRPDLLAAKQQQFVIPYGGDLGAEPILIGPQPLATSLSRSVDWTLL